ncbi:MAG: glycosyltransferase family 2 protein [Anaerolineae bacterium]|nr:glycosyltransferase family 2 protein [Anaerolineae bacterium]
MPDQNMPGQPLPEVSIILPVRDEAPFIRCCLEGILAQDYPADRIEILVVDGRSQDDTRDIVAALAARDPRIRLLDNPRRIISTGLNVGLQAAQGAIIVRVDGHVILAPDYVRQCVATLAATGADNVGGELNPVGLTPMGRAIAAASKTPFAVPGTFYVGGEPQVIDTVYLGAWRREVFDRVGGFNPALRVNEDFEHNYRIRAAGGTVYFTPAIQSRYYKRQSLRMLTGQYWRYGKGKVKTLRLYPGSLRLRQVAAPLFVAGLVIGLLAGLLLPPLLLLWGGMVAAYACLTLIFARRAARAAGIPIWRVALVYPTIHLAWGAGFWVGMLRDG